MVVKMKDCECCSPWGGLYKKLLLLPSVPLHLTLQQGVENAIWSYYKHNCRASGLFCCCASPAPWLLLCCMSGQFCSLMPSCKICVLLIYCCINSVLYYSDNWSSFYFTLLPLGKRILEVGLNWIASGGWTSVLLHKQTIRVIVSAILLKGFNIINFEQRIVHIIVSF